MKMFKPVFLVINGVAWVVIIGLVAYLIISSLMLGQYKEVAMFVGLCVAAVLFVRLVEKLLKGLLRILF